MTIAAGSDILAADFITESAADTTYANDSGRVPKLESDGKLSGFFLRHAFGGTGADGALTITSGTTSIDVGAARVYVLNYKSISITGTGSLAFTNPHSEGTLVIIKCKGNCTLTSSAAPMIDCSSMGAVGGTGGTQNSAGSNANGNTGTDGKSYGLLKTNGGVGQTSGTAAGGAVAALSYPQVSGAFIQATMKYLNFIAIGAGGGGAGAVWTSGGSGSVIGGNGGRGGGCLIMEIAGAINFTTTNGISVAGANGSNGNTSGTPDTYHAGGGGGGGGGVAIILYTTQTAFSGTVNVSGGTGGNNKRQNGGAEQEGAGGGGSLWNAGNACAGASSTNGAQSGGNGGAGYDFHGLVTDLT